MQRILLQKQNQPSFARIRIHTAVRQRTPTPRNPSQDGPMEIVTVNIGPETGLGTGTHDTEFFISDFDILVPTTV